MWFRGDMSPQFIVLFALIVYKGCEAITNADFNAQIRDYSVLPDNVNLTEVKTLQKQGLGLSRYASFAPVQNPVKFKDVPDSVLSGSNHARGLHHDTGFGFDYEDPHYGQGYEFQHHGDHHDPHDYHHYDFRSPGHHHGYGYHKHYDHGLATKHLLWPIAGIALLGAAAALVSNPVLLQLGVVSGKRRRRQIEEIENVAKDSIKKWTQTAGNKGHSRDITHKIVKKRMLRKEVTKEKGDLFQFQPVTVAPVRYSEEDRRFIPIPLKLKEN